MTRRCRLSLVFAALMSLSVLARLAAAQTLPPTADPASAPELAATVPDQFVRGGH